MEILKLLSGLESVEGSLAELYTWLSECLASDAEVAGVFFRLSLQEESHVNLVRYGRKLARRTAGRFRPVTTGAEPVTELLAAIGSFREGHPEPTVEDALRFALWAESHAAERIHRTVVVEANPSLSGVVASLAAADREHRAMLEVVARRRGLGVDPG